MENAEIDTPFTLEDIRELQSYIGLVKTANPREMTFADDVPVELQQRWLTYASCRDDLNRQLEKHGIEKV